jgi:hypothetical protein
MVEMTRMRRRCISSVEYCCEDFFACRRYASCQRISFVPTARNGCYLFFLPTFDSDGVFLGFYRLVMGRPRSMWAKASALTFRVPYGDIPINFFNKTNV